jgi:hypothetical protein
MRPDAKSEPSASDQRWRAAVVGIAVALAIVVVAPFVLRGSPLRHDHVGHWAAAWFTKERLFPSLFGWNPLFFCGAPQNQLYPPLTTWLSAALGMAMPVARALAVWVGIAVVATPLAIAACARALGLGWRAAALAALGATAFLAADPEELGGTLRSTIEIGNVANALHLPLFFGWIAVLAAGLRRPSLPTLLGASALLGLGLLCHLVGGVVSLVVLAGALAVAARAPTADRRRALEFVVAHGGLALALSAAFTIPLALRLRYGADAVVSFNQHPDPLISLLASGAVVAAWLLSRRPDPARARLLPLVVAAGLLLFARNFVFNDFFPASMGLHLHRYRLYDTLLLVVVAAWWAERALDARPRLALAFALAFAAVATIGMARVARLPPLAITVPPIPVEPPGRLFVVSSPRSQPTDHAVQHLVAVESGRPVAKGLFLEGAGNSRHLLELELLLAHPDFPPRTWGVRLDPPEVRAARRPRLGALLRHFGFGAVVADEPLSPSPALGAPRPLADGFQLTPLREPAPLAEIVRGPLAPVAPAAFAEAARAWFDAPSERPLPVAVAPGAPPPTELAANDEPSARVDARMDADGQGLTLQIDAARPVPVLVKMGWFPNWLAKDASGRALPLHRAAPSLMLLVAHGPVSLRYGPTRLDVALGVLSVAAWAALLLAAAALALTRRRRGRARRLALAGAISVGLALGVLAGPHTFAGARGPSTPRPADPSIEAVGPGVVP